MAVTAKAADGTSVKANEPQREPVWNPKRTACVKAMRALGAINNQTARTATEIANKMGVVEGVRMADRVDQVKIFLDVYRVNELVHNGFVKSVRHEGERELRYFLTAKGVKTTFPEKERKTPVKANAATAAKSTKGTNGSAAKAGNGKAQPKKKAAATK